MHSILAALLHSERGAGLDTFKKSDDTKVDEMSYECFFN